MGSCKKPETNTGLTSSLKANNPNPYPFEIELLEATNINFTQSSYKGMINDSAVTLLVSGNSISFQVPELSAGSYNLKVNLEGTDYNVNLNVKEKPVIQDPKKYLVDFASQASSTVTQVHALLTQLEPFADTASLGKDLEILDKDYADAMTAYTQSSPQEQMKAAQVIAANRAWIDEMHNTVQAALINFNTLKFNKTDDIEGDQLNAYNALLTTQMTILRIDIAKALAFTLIGAAIFPGAGAAIGGLIGLVDVMHDLNAISTITSKGIALTLIGVITNSNKKVQSMNFVSGKATTHFITINLRSLTKADVNTDETVTSGFISAVTEINGWIEKIKSVLGPDKSISSETQNVAKIETPLATAMRIVSSKYLTIKNISNPKVTLKSITDSAEFVSFFFANSDTTPQTFTCDLVYENPGITKNITNYTCSITKADNSMFYLTGGSTKSWKVDPSGRSTSCHRLVNPDCMMDNIYTFSADGTFSYNPGTVTKCDSACSDGMASTQSFHFSDDRKQLIIGSSIYNISKLTSGSLRMNIGDEYDLVPR